MCSEMNNERAAETIKKKMVVKKSFETTDSCQLVIKS